MVWLAIYQTLIPASEALVDLWPVERDSHLGGALQFFLYDTPKVLMLLTGVVFVMGMVNSYFTPERTRALLAGRTKGVANVMAASLGIRVESRLTRTVGGCGAQPERCGGAGSGGGCQAIDKAP